MTLAMALMEDRTQDLRAEAIRDRQARTARLEARGLRRARRAHRPR